MNAEERKRLSRKGLDARLPALECFPTEFSDFVVTHIVPEYTSVCPKTGLPDFGTITVSFVPGKLCVELKSFKTYIHGYRNVGISYENAVNRILADLNQAMKPKWIRVRGEFTPRGGIRSVVECERGRLPSGVGRP